MNFLPYVCAVAGCLWGLFLGLLPFAAAAALLLTMFDPKRKEPGS